MAYVCKDPSCTETVAWHLIHGDLECIGDNKEAVAAFARGVEAGLMPVNAVVTVEADGYETHVVSVVMERQGEVVEAPPHDMDNM